MLDWRHDRVDRLRLEPTHPLGEVSGDEIEEHRVMRQAVVVELVVGGTLLVEARRADQRAGVPVLAQQLVARREERAGEVLLPRVGVGLLHPPLERRRVAGGDHPLPREQVDGICARALVEQARAFRPRETLEIAHALGQHFRWDGEAPLLGIEQKVLGVHGDIGVYVGVGGPEPVGTLLVLP